MKHVHDMTKAIDSADATEHVAWVATEPMKITAESPVNPFIVFAILGIVMGIALVIPSKLNPVWEQ